MLQSSGKWKPYIGKMGPTRTELFHVSLVSRRYVLLSTDTSSQDDFQRENYALFFIHSQATPDCVNVPTMKADCTQHVLQLPPS